VIDSKEIYNQHEIYKKGHAIRCKMIKNMTATMLSFFSLGHANYMRLLIGMMMEPKYTNIKIRNYAKFSEWFIETDKILSTENENVQIPNGNGEDISYYRARKSNGGVYYTEKYKEDLLRKKFEQYLKEQQTIPVKDRKKELAVFIEDTRNFGKKLKQDAYQAQNGRCTICKKVFDYGVMEGDHILPRSLGGKTVHDNLQMLCVTCNRNKINDVEM
jgi:hypothetical protein